MRVTKRDHATLIIEKDDAALVVDPGGFTAPFPPPAGLVAVVLTHEHPDHWTPEHLDRLREAYPGLPVYGPPGVALAAPDHGVRVVEPGDELTAGPFDLRFFGGRHAVIHESIPVIDNVGVLVDGVFYYPGDSYAVPDDVEVEVLAAPIGAPWLKIGEAMDFVLAVRPRRAFGTHDRTLSEIGLGFARVRLAWATEQGGGEFLALGPGEAVEL